MNSQGAALIGEKDYCDQAQLLLQEYSRLQIVEFTEELDHLDKWVHNDSQPCLLITGDPHSGKKTLLYSFLKAQRSAHPNWLFIPQFGSVTPIYYNILYKTMIELRNHFKIKQRVDLNEEKLRRYFKYWLEVTSDFLQKEYLGYQRQEVPKVVIILEGIDLCIDSKGNPVEPQFWLPSNLPPHIKIILTSKVDQTHLIGNCTVLRHQISKEKKDKIIGKFNPNIKMLFESNKDLKLHCLYCINEMLALKPKLNTKGKQFDSILHEYIGMVADSELTAEVIKSFLFVLTLTRKGLRSRELCKMVNISTGKWENFMHNFSFLLVSSGCYFMICDKMMREMIGQLVDPTQEKAKTYRNSIVKNIKKESIRLRELEEVVFQLLMGESYCELKEVISRIQNFIMLYTPLSKELLCQCWVKLEQIQQFDPVYEYNKAIESYTSHYYPKEEELYKIIFQICMFFKEYAEFQNPRTPAFRHPLIKGEVDSLESIGIYEELKNLTMVGKCKVSKLKPIEKSDITWNGSYSKIDSNDTKLNGLNLKKTRVNKASNQSDPQTLECNSSEKVTEKLIQEQIGEDGDGELIKASEDNSILNVEELNVGIISNQQKFRQHFLGQMKEYLEKYFLPLKKSSYKEKYLTFQAEDSENQEDSLNDKGGEKELKVDIDKLKESFILKHYKQYLDESYHKKGEQVQHYYYKQWVWLQFPWLCQTIKNVYSNMLKECLPGSIHFMSPTREFQLIRDVIKIARVAKESKLGIYTHKQLEIVPIKIKVNKIDLEESNVRSKRDERTTQKSNTGDMFKKMTEDASRLTYRVNKGNIDEAILKEKLEQSRLKEKTNNDRRLKGDSSMPNLNLFMTETNEKETYMFPTIKQSKFGGDKSRRKEKENNQDTRNYTLLIRKYNEFKHENDMLVEKIQEAKRLQEIQSDKSEEQIQTLNKSVEQIQLKKAQIERNHSNQIELRKKLEVIIKICDLNKMYGSETDYLSHYLQSLKKMIECEENKVKHIKKNIQQSIDKGKIALKELRNKKKELKTQKEMPTIPYNSICTDSTNMRLTEMGLVEIEHELKQMSRCIKQKSKKPKSVKTKHFLSYHDYELLQQEIGIRYGNTDNEQKIQQFADKYEKLKYLKMKTEELKRDQRERQSRVEKLRAASKTQWEGEAREKEIRVANELVQRRKQLASVKSRNLLLLHAMSALKT